MTPCIALKNVSKRFGDTEAVKDVSLTLHDGEFVALLGASGCGKSTTLRLLAGLESPSDGQVVLRNRDVTQESPADRNIALMFQSYALYPHLTVFQNISMPLRLRGLSVVQRLPGMAHISTSVREQASEIAARVHQMADMLRLDGLLERKPGQLSGGQQQRVALARALVREPSAFLLDEPLSNLDTQLRADTREEIRSIHRRTGYPFLLVTHDQSDALSMADKIAVMIAGRIAQFGTPKEIFRKPKTVAVAEFIGHHRINMLPAGAATALHPAGRQLSLGVRPEDLRIAPEGSMEATVESLSFHGEETILRLVGTAQQSLTLVLRRADKLPNAGDSVRLAVDPSALHGFDSEGNRREFLE